MLAQFYLILGIIVFLITVIEYRYGGAIGKFSLRTIKREENPGVFKLIIGIQLLAGIVLIVLSKMKSFQ